MSRLIFAILSFVVYRLTATRNATTGVIMITALGCNPVSNSGQPTGRVSPIFGTGGPRALQLAARISF